MSLMDKDIRNIRVKLLLVGFFLGSVSGGLVVALVSLV